jgi:hypothetical protein
MSDCGLIDDKNLRKFLGYWIDILNGVRGNKSVEFVSVIDSYLVFYDWMDVRNFLFVKNWWNRF